MLEKDGKIAFSGLRGLCEWDDQCAGSHRGPGNQGQVLVPWPEK